MKSGKRFLFFAVLTCFVSIGFAAPPKSPKELRDRIESALRSNDTNAFFALYNWNGVAADTIAFQKEMVSGIFTKDFKGTVELSSKQITSEETHGLDGIMGDYHYFPNLQMVGQISVTPSKEREETNNAEAITFTGLGLFFGKTNGDFFLPGMLKEKLSPTMPRPVTLSIYASAWFSSKPCLLNGSYTYVLNGTLSTNTFVATNNLSLMFWGDSIETCQVVRDTNECAIDLEIKTNGKEIFKSGLISHTNSVQFTSKL